MIIIRYIHVCDFPKINDLIILNGQNLQLRKKLNNVFFDAKIEQNEEERNTIPDEHLRFAKNSLQIISINS